MTGQTRAVFRADVVRRHLRDGEATVLPTLVSSKVFGFLWLLLGLLLAGGILVSLRAISLLPMMDRLLGE